MTSGSRQQMPDSDANFATEAREWHADVLDKFWQNGAIFP